MIPDVEGATVASQNKEYIAQFIDDIKAGKKRYSFFRGGDKYIKMVDYRLKRETDKFMYVEAIATTRKYEAKLKTFKFVKPYDGLNMLIR